MIDIFLSFVMRIVFSDNGACQLSLSRLAGESTGKSRVCTGASDNGLDYLAMMRITAESAMPAQYSTQNSIFNAE